MDIECTDLYKKWIRFCKNHGCYEKYILNISRFDIIKYSLRHLLYVKHYFIVFDNHSNNNNFLKSYLELCFHDLYNEFLINNGIVEQNEKEHKNIGELFNTAIEGHVEERENKEPWYITCSKDYRMYNYYRRRYR